MQRGVGVEALISCLSVPDGGTLMNMNNITNLTTNSSSSDPSRPMSTEPERNTPEYLQQLLKDKKQIQAFPNVFQHLERLLDDEIFKVRLSLFHIFLTNMVEPLELEDPQGTMVTLSDKVYVPTKEYPDFNFVGRLLGPRGTTAKFLEHVLNCKIMVRGKNSMRDKVKEEQNRGKPHWEHLNDELHVLLTVEEAQNRAEPLLKRAVKGIKKFMEVIPEGEDFLKRTQLMELAAYNNQQPKGLQKHAQMLPQMQGLQGLPHMVSFSPQEAPRLNMPQQYAVQAAMRSPTPAGAPIILHPRLQNPQASTAGLLSGMPPPGMMSPTEAATMIYGNPYGGYGDYAQHMPTLLDYQSAQQAAHAQMEQQSAAAVTTGQATNLTPGTTLSGIVTPSSAGEATAYLTNG